MQVGGLTGYEYYNANSLSGTGAVSKVSGLGATGTNIAPIEAVKKIQQVEDTGTKISDPNKARLAAISGREDEVNPIELKALKHAGVIKCNTCASRTYKDGSDEANVSFKSAAHVDPAQSEAAVSAHEGMHVANAVNKAASDSSTTLLSASVSIKYATCPECGRSYAAGGLTTTEMSHTEKQSVKQVNSNQYVKNQRSLEEMQLKGAYVDTAA